MVKEKCNKNIYRFFEPGCILTGSFLVIWRRKLDLAQNLIGQQESHDLALKLPNFHYYFKKNILFLIQKYYT